METLLNKKPVVRARPLRHVGFSRTAYPLGHPADECPACHSGAMCWIAANHGYNYLCEACGRSWTLGQGGAIGATARSADTS